MPKERNLRIALKLFYDNFDQCIIFKAIFSFFGQYYIVTLINFGNFEGVFSRDIIECL